MSGTVKAFTHYGLCVSELDRSMRFYTEGLGFQHVITHQIGNEYGKALEVDGDVKLQSVFLQRDGISMEILAYESPSTYGTPSANRNQLGLTHLSFAVDDVDSVVEKLVALGGSVQPETDTKMDGGGRLIFCADPDGTRVELIEYPPA
jgi:catechol 2,3-dioxygenase-like lactoylglutathione lyase family enzyme